jgi:hypothetical protein
MASKDQDRVQTPEQIAKANRQRVAAADGALAMVEVTKNDIAVRKNMARLRELRLSKEAETPEPDATAKPKKAKAKTAKRPKSL